MIVLAVEIVTKCNFESAKPPQCLNAPPSHQQKNHINRNCPHNTKYKNMIETMDEVSIINTHLQDWTQGRNYFWSISIYDKPIE